MGDSENKGSKLGRCCCLFFLLLILAVAGTVGYAYTSFKSMRQDEPLAFEPVKRSELEEGLLSAKFKVNELPSRLLGGDTVIRLGERELNTLLFAQAEHSEGGQKARILLEEKSMWVEAVKPLDDGGYLNLRVHVSLILTKGAQPQLRLLGGTVGEFELGPMTRPMAEDILQKALLEASRREPKIKNAVGFEVKNHEVYLTYPPEGLEEKSEPLER